MRNRPLLPVLSVLLLLAPASLRAEEGRPARYLRPEGAFTLTVTQSIEIRMDPPIHASREMVLELDLAADAADGPVSVTIRDAKATSTAHGMTQRLGASHLPGATFTLLRKDGGRWLECADPEGPGVQLGPAGSWPVPALVARVLPRLPAGPVGKGSEWSTERKVRSLQGWSWGSGLLAGRHKVTDLSQAGGSSVLSVTTEGEARLDPGEDGGGFTGTLSQRSAWSFDASRGSLLSIAIDEESEGEATGPRGSMTFNQVTHIDLEPSS